MVMDHNRSCSEPEPKNLSVDRKSYFKSGAIRVTVPLIRRVHREDGSLKKTTVFWSILSFVAGATLGVLGGALLVSLKVVCYETDAIAIAGI